MNKKRKLKTESSISPPAARNFKIANLSILRTKCCTFSRFFLLLLLWTFAIFFSILIFSIDALKCKAQSSEGVRHNLLVFESPCYCLNTTYFFFLIICNFAILDFNCVILPSEYMVFAHLLNFSTWQIASIAILTWHMDEVDE